MNKDEKDIRKVILLISLDDEHNIQILVPHIISIEDLKTRIAKELEMNEKDIIKMDIVGNRVFINDGCKQNLVFPIVDVSDWKFYPEAYDHYGSVTANVICDYCGKDKLKSCWGKYNYILT